MYKSPKQNISCWPDAVRLKMIEKSEFYGDSSRVYEYGYYDGYQRQNEKINKEWRRREKIGMRELNKHTPGPWFAVDNGFYFDIKVGPLYYSQNICTVHPNSTIPIDKETAKANAILIAAAPDLLEALERLFKIHTDKIGLPNDQLLNKVAAAIAKANGKDTGND